MLLWLIAKYPILVVVSVFPCLVFAGSSCSGLARFVPSKNRCITPARKNINCQPLVLMDFHSFLHFFHHVAPPPCRVYFFSRSSAPSFLSLCPYSFLLLSPTSHARSPPPPPLTTTQPTRPPPNISSQIETRLTYTKRTT